MSLLDKRILMVTGKGGVGKTTVSVAIALAAAARGKRVIIAETSGAEVVPPLFDSLRGGYEPHPVSAGVSTLSITPEAALEDYVVQQIRFRSLFKLVFRNRIVKPFTDAVPGLHDAVQLGKVFDLERASRPGGQPLWDLIVVDAPATGHGLTMLGSAQTMMDLTRAGPMFEGVRQVQEVMADPVRSALVLVSLPESMPTSETLDLYRRLDDQQRAQVGAVVLNSLYPRPLPQEDWDAARPLLADAPPAVAEAAAMVDRWQGRVQQQADARAKLAGIPCPLLELRHRFDGSPDAAALLEMGEALLAQEEA